MLNISLILKYVHLLTMRQFITGYKELLRSTAERETFQISAWEQLGLNLASAVE